MKQEKLLLTIMLFGITICMSSCLAQHNPLSHTANTVGHVAGFWCGLWHGIIAPITLIISLCYCEISMYEVHNNGGWYNFGFILGISFSAGGIRALLMRGIMSFTD